MLSFMKKRQRFKMNKDDKTLTEVRETIGHKIQEIRKRSSHSAEKVAKALNITREALTQIETGRNNANAVLLWRLAYLFNCKVEDFFPNVPSGFSLNKVDLRLLAKEDERAPEWAQKLQKISNKENKNVSKKD